MKFVVFQGDLSSIGCHLPVLLLTQMYQLASRGNGGVSSIANQNPSCAAGTESAMAPMTQGSYVLGLLASLNGPLTSCALTLPSQHTAPPAHMQMPTAPKPAAPPARPVHVVRRDFSVVSDTLSLYIFEPVHLYLLQEL